MDPVMDHAALVKRFLGEYASFKPSYGDVQVETVFDDTQGHQAFQSPAKRKMTDFAQG